MTRAHSERRPRMFHDVLSPDELESRLELKKFKTWAPLSLYLGKGVPCWVRDGFVLGVEGDWTSNCAVGFVTARPNVVKTKLSCATRDQM